MRRWIRVSGTLPWRSEWFAYERPTGRFGRRVVWRDPAAGGWRRGQLFEPQARLKSGEPITLKKLGALSGYEQRQCSTLKRRAALCASQRGRATSESGAVHGADVAPAGARKNHSISRFTHGWRRGPHDDARYAGFRTTQAVKLTRTGRCPRLLPCALTGHGKCRLQAHPALLRAIWVCRGKQRASLHIHHAQAAKFRFTLVRQYGGSHLAFRAPHESLPQTRTPFPDCIPCNGPAHGNAHDRFPYDCSHRSHSRARVRPHQPRGSLINNEGIPSCRKNQAGSPEVG